VFGIDDLDIASHHQAQAEFLDAHLDDRRTADQYRLGDLFVDDGLGRPQDAFVFAVGIDDPLGRALGLHEQRSHQLARVIHQAHQLLTIGFQILDGAAGYAGKGGCLGHGWCDLDNQAWIKGLGNDVVGAERQLLARISQRDFVVLLGFSQLGEGLAAGQLHFFMDDRGADVHGSAEYEGEAQHVIDLIGIVRPAGRDNAVRPGGLGDLGADFRLRIGQRKNQGTGSHGLHHISGQHTGCRAPQEYVGVLAHVGQGAGVGFLRVASLVGLHVLFASHADDATRIHDIHIGALQPKVHQQVQASNGGGARAGTHQLHVAYFLVDDFQAIDDGGGRYDGRPVLVVMESRYLHALAELLLYVETFGRLDVFQVDPAQRGFQGGDDVHQLVGIGFRKFNVEHVDAGELLEQTS